MSSSFCSLISLIWSAHHFPRATSAFSLHLNMADNGPTSSPPSPVATPVTCMAPSPSRKRKITSTCSDSVSHGNLQDETWATENDVLHRVWVRRGRAKTDRCVRVGTWAPDWHTGWWKCYHQSVGSAGSGTILKAPPQELTGGSLKLSGMWKSDLKE